MPKGKPRRLRSRPKCLALLKLKPLGITEALWKKGLSEDDEIGNVYVPLTVEELSANFLTKLKDLSEKDSVESKKIHSFQKRAETEPDEEFKLKF